MEPGIYCLKIEEGRRHGELIDGDVMHLNDKEIKGIHRYTLCQSAGDEGLILTITLNVEPNIEVKKHPKAKDWTIEHKVHSEDSNFYNLRIQGSNVYLDDKIVGTLRNYCLDRPVNSRPILTLELYIGPTYCSES